MGLLSFPLGYLLAILLNLFIREKDPDHGLFGLGKNCGKGMSSEAQNLATGGQKANKIRGVGQHTCSPRRRQSYGHH